MDFLLHLYNTKQNLTSVLGHPSPDAKLATAKEFIQL